MDELGQIEVGYSGAYAPFQRLRAAVDRAELIAIDAPNRIDLTYGGDEQIERVYRQYVSGWMFSAFGLKPAAGRLFVEDDDVQPGAHPYAVLSYSYWTQRFGKDPSVIGRTFRVGNDIVRVIGVSAEGFTGTESGVITDLFMPITMHVLAVESPNWDWFRTWVQLRPGIAAEPVRQELRAALLQYRQEQFKTRPPGMTQHRVDQFLNASVVLESAAAGVSDFQHSYRLSLGSLGAVAFLVLLIACANVANLMSAQAASRTREMALRVAIGAGRARLVQLVLIESSIIAVFASAVGVAFAWWAAPFVVGMINPPDHPVRLIMAVDWRVSVFAVVLTVAVTMFFGLGPALRTSSVKPASALKGGEQLSRRRGMNALISAQVAFCLLVTFTAGLFRASFERLAHQPVGFSADRVLTLETVAKTEQPGMAWYRLVEHLRTLPGIESASLASWALMTDTGWNADVWANGHIPDDRTRPLFMGVSPGWLETMKIPLIAGRDFREDDLLPRVAVVNQAFARRYFDGRSPIGSTFEMLHFGTTRVTVRIVGLSGDARYETMREPILPTAYFPYRGLGEGTSKTAIRRLGHVNRPFHRSGSDGARISIAKRSAASQLQLSRLQYPDAAGTDRDAYAPRTFARCVIDVLRRGGAGPIRHRPLWRAQLRGCRAASGTGNSDGPWRSGARPGGLRDAGSIRLGRSRFGDWVGPWDRLGTLYRRFAI